MSQATDDAIRLLNREGYVVFRRKDRHITSSSLSCDEDFIDEGKEILRRRFPAVAGLEARVEPDYDSSGPWNRKRVTVGFVYYPDTAEAKPEGVNVAEFRHGNHGSYTVDISRYRIREPVGMRIVMDPGLAPNQRRVRSDREGGHWYDPDDPGRASPWILEEGERIVSTGCVNGVATQIIERSAPTLGETLWAENDARLGE